MSKESKKITFSEEIDSIINGYALGFSFIGIGIFLLLRPMYFFSPIISYIVGAFSVSLVLLALGLNYQSHQKLKEWIAFHLGWSL